jgi:cytochrome c
MKNLLFACMTSTFLLAGCNEQPAPAQAPTPQTTDQAMQASKDEAKAAIENAKSAAANVVAATNDATVAASTRAKQATEQLVIASKETADTATMAVQEAANKATTATENAVKDVSAATNPIPTTMPDWLRPPIYDCASCHRIATKLVGPAWKDVAEKYKGVAGAENMLMEKVRKGGKGNWDQVTGGVPMSPHPDISDADLKKVLDFELSLTK